MSNSNTTRMDQIKEGAREFAGDASDAASNAKDQLGNFKDEVVSAVKSALSSARDGLRSTGGRVGEAYDSAKEKGAEAVDSLEDQVSRHPLIAIAVAAGVGALVGMLMRRR